MSHHHHHSPPLPTAQMMPSGIIWAFIYYPSPCSLMQPHPSPLPSQQLASWDYISTTLLLRHKCDLWHKGHAASWGHVPGRIRHINLRTTCKVPISIGTLNNWQCDILRVHGQYCGMPISENCCVKGRNIGIYTTDG